jgi:hypothetical protein
MAERQQINPLVTVATRDLLRQAAQERKCSQGELVESALLAFLLPSDQATQEPLLFERMLAIEEILGQMLGLLHKIITVQEAQIRPPDPPPIATYEQMYGPLDAAPAPGTEDPGLSAAAAPLPPPRGRLRRWLLREEGA